MKLSPSIDLLRSLNTVLGDGAGAPERAREDGARQRATVRAILGRFFRPAASHRREMVILADEVGLGKTYVALASAISILDAIRRNEAPDDLAARMPAVLVLTPVNEALHNKWIREVSSFRAECAGPSGSLDWIVPAAGQCDNLIKLTSAIRNTSKAAPAIVVAKTSAFGARLHDVETWRRRALAATFEHCEIPSEERIPWRQMVLGSGSQAREPELRDLSRSAPLWERTEEWAPNLREKYLSALRRDRILAVRLLHAAAHGNAGGLFAALDDLTRSALMACWPTLPLVVIDEVHNLKNAQTAARKNLHRWLAGKASRVLALSATPFQLAHEELSSVLGLRDLAVLPDDRRSALDAQVLHLEAAMRDSRHEGDLFRARWLDLGAADQAAVDAGWSEVSGASQADREAVLSRVQPLRVEKALRAALRLQAANQALQKHLGPFVIRHRRDTSHRSYWVGRNAIPSSNAAAAAPGFDWSPGAEVDPGSELIHYVFMRVVSLAKDGKGRAALGEELTGSYRHLTQTAANWKKLERSDNPRLLAYKHFLDCIIAGDGADKRHPKIRLTVDRVVEAFRNGHKSMVFCVHTKTAEAVRDEILRCVSRDLEATRDAVFGSKSSGYFAAEHGPSACALAFRVKDSHQAYNRALELGAQPIEIPTGPMELRLPAIKGIGGAPLYLIDRFEDGKSIYDIDFEWLPGVERHPRGVGLTVVDHLTHNVYRGRMAHWAAFYEKLFNFREIRYFDIQGEYTGLTSKAMTAPDGMIRIPLNEESGTTSGQIEEFLMKFSGEGIQHVALLTDNLVETVDQLQMAGVPLMTAPNDIYYEMLEERLPGHCQPVPELQARGILLDGDTSSGKPRLLLQIFSETLLGPVFFEFIQRAGDDGFGNGNFQALFESLERDQIRRGVLQVEDKEAA